MSLIEEPYSGNTSKRDLILPDIQKKPLPDVVLQRPLQPLDQQSSFNITSQPDDRVNEKQLSFNTKRQSYLNIKVEKTKKIRFLIQNQHNFYKVYRIQQIALQFIQKLKLQTNMITPSKDNKMIRDLLYVQFRGVPIIGISQNQNKIKRIFKNAQNFIQTHLFNLQQIYDISSIVIFSIFSNQIIEIDIILITISIIIIILKILEPVYIQGEEQPIIRKLPQIDLLYLSSLFLQICDIVLQQQELLNICAILLLAHFIYNSTLKNLYESNIFKLSFRLLLILILYFIVQIGLINDEKDFQYNFFKISQQFFVGENFKYQIQDQIIIFGNPIFKLYIISQLIIYVLLNEQEIKNLRELKKIHQVTKELQEQGFKKNLQQKVKSYLHNLVNQDRLSQQKQYIQSYQQILPDEIKKDIMLTIQLSFLQKHSLFKRFTQSTLRKITQILITEEYNPKDVILIDKDIDDCSIYLIHQGQCSINYPQEVGIHENEIIFSVGQSIGDIGFVTGLPRTATVVSNQFTKVFRLKRADFLKVIQSNPQDNEQFCYIRDEILFSNNYQALDISCFCCKQTNHALYQCPLLQYKPHKERIVLQILNTVNKFRQKFKRFKRTKINTRSSIRYITDKVEEIRNHLYYEDLENSSDYTVPASDNIYSLNRQFSSISKNTANKQSLSNPISQEQYVLKSVEKNSKDQFDQEFDELLKKDESFLQLDGQFQRKSGQKQTFATAGFGINETGTMKSNPKNQMLVIDEKVSDEQKSQSLNRSSDQHLMTIEHKQKQYNMNASLSIKEYGQKNRQNNRSLTYTTPQSVSPNLSQKSIPIKLSPNLTYKQGSGQNLTNHVLPQSVLDNEDNNNISIKSKSLSRYFQRSISKKQSNTKTKSNIPFTRTIQSQQMISDFKPFSTVDNLPEQRLEFGLRNFERFQEYQLYYPLSNLSKVVSRLSQFQMYLVSDHKYSLWFETRQQIKQRSIAYRVKR